MLGYHGSEAPFDQNIDPISARWCVGLAITNYCKQCLMIDINTNCLIKKLEQTSKDHAKDMDKFVRPSDFDEKILFDIKDMNDNKCYCLRIEVEETNVENELCLDVSKCINNEIHSKCNIVFGGEEGLFTTNKERITQCMFVAHICRNEYGDYLFCVEKNNPKINQFTNFPTLKSKPHYILYKITVNKLAETPC